MYLRSMKEFRKMVFFSIFPRKKFWNFSESEISEGSEIHSTLTRKNLRKLEKQKCLKFTCTARKCLYIVGKVHWTGLQASATHQKVVSETRDCANSVDGLSKSLLHQKLSRISFFLSENRFGMSPTLQKRILKSVESEKCQRKIFKTVRENRKLSVKNVVGIIIS